MLHKYLEEWEIVHYEGNEQIFLFDSDTKYFDSKIRLYLEKNKRLPFDAQVDGFLIVMTNPTLEWFTNTTGKQIVNSFPYCSMWIPKVPNKNEVKRILELIVNNIKMFTYSIHNNKKFEKIVFDIVNNVLRKPDEFIHDHNELIKIASIFSPTQLISLYDKFLLEIPFFYSDKVFKNHARTYNNSSFGWKPLPKENYFSYRDPNYYIITNMLGSLDTLNGTKGLIIYKCDISTSTSVMRVNEVTFINKTNDLLSLEWILIVSDNDKMVTRNMNGLKSLGFPGEKIFHTK